ncbi:uncharacterized protein LOC144446840 [Glandiceps talaboti]
MSKKRDQRLHINVTWSTVVLENWQGKEKGDDFKVKLDGLRDRGLHLDSEEYKNKKDLKRTLERRTDIPARYWQVKDSKGKMLQKTKPGGRYSASPVNPDEDTSDEESTGEPLYRQYADMLSQQSTDESCATDGDSDSDSDSDSDGET